MPVQTATPMQRAIANASSLRRAKSQGTLVKDLKGKPIKSGFMMKASETERGLRTALEEKVKGMLPKRKRTKSDGKTILEPCYAYVSEIGEGKAIVESEGRKYGVRFRRDGGTGELIVTQPVNIETIYAEVSGKAVGKITKSNDGGYES